MASVNPKSVSWTNPTTYTDGSTYAQTDNAGYTLQLDSTPSISIPLAWGTSFDLTTLSAYTSLKKGSHTVSVAAVSKDGIPSAFGTPATFQVAVAPNSPTNVVVV